MISQAQSTRAALGSQRALFGDVQGKVKVLGDKFPVIRGLIGNPLEPHLMLLFLFEWPIHFILNNSDRFNQKEAIKRHPDPCCSYCSLYSLSYYLLALKVVTIIYT